MSSFALFIDAHEAVAKTQRQIQSPVNKTGLPLLVGTGIDAALAELKTQDVAGARPALVLLGPHLENPVAVARRLYREAPLAHLAFLAYGSKTALTQQLKSPVAMVGNYWSIIDLASDNLTTLLQEAVDSAQQRLQLRTTLNHINVQLSSQPPADFSELQRYTVSDRFLANVLEHAHDAIIATDNEGVIITWNKAAQNMFGLSPDDAVGSPIDEVASGDWPEQLPGLLAQIHSSESAYSRQELVCRRSDGQTLNVELILSLVRRQSGKPMGVSAVVRDITERKRAGKALRESEARYRTVVETASDGIITIDSNSTILFFNPAAEKIFGYKADEVVGRKITTLMPERLRQAHAMSLRNYLETGQKHIVWSGPELTGLHHSGREMPLEVSFREFDKDGERLFTGIVRDITERKQAEKALRESEEQFRLAVEAAPNAMVMVNPQGQIILANRQTEVLFGYARQELIGRKIEDLIPARFQKGHPALRDGYLAAPEARPMGAGRDLFALRKDGSEFPVEIGLTPIETAEGVFVLSAIMDNTVRKQLEDALRKTNLELERRVEQRTQELTEANKKLERSNIELTRFAYIASHDLQSPLRSISGFLQLLQEEYQGQLDEQADHWINRVVENTNRMKTLINDLLSYSRVDSRARPFTHLAFRRVFDDAVNSLQGSIQDTNAEITCGDLPSVSGDRPQLVQLMQNLIENAIKYNESPRPQVHVSAQKEGNEWVFSVRDNGIGIEVKHDQKIFEIFNRLHSQQTYPGTGIGLAVCRRIVHRHGGRIWVESRPGEGSTFYFTIPERTITYEQSPEE